MYRSVPARCLAGRWSCSLSHKLVGREVGCSLDIAARGGATVRLEVNPVIGKRLTRNVLADTALNRGSSFIIVGAHLDSGAGGAWHQRQW
jgi:hypothetical protein